MKLVLMLAIVVGGASDYSIVVSNEASPTEQWAAQDLAAHIKEMTGVELPVVTEGAEIPNKAIFIGAGALVKKLGVNVDLAKLGTDGFIIKSVGPHLIIAGGRRRGTMYGVYELLSSLGCRWWAAGESTIPKTSDIKLSPMNIEKVPVLEYRDMLYREMAGGSNSATASPAEQAAFLASRRWAARNRVHASWYAMPEELGPMQMDRGLAHGMIKYLPAKKYMQDHPEWYALRGTKRRTDHICLANAEAATEMARNVIAQLDKHPQWRLITLGQADNDNFCTCVACKALVEKYQANSGMMIHFINRVARVVKQKHADVYINTNAYRWSQAAPVGIRCDDHVMITIPPIACNYSEPLDNGWPKENADYVRDLENWGKLTNKIYVWDYATDFVHYVMPWPHWHVIAPNIRFFIRNNVRGIFNQGSHTTNNGQFSKMSMWILAQVMWNPEANSMELAEEFCQGYYGPKAGPIIYTYLAMLVDKVSKERIPIWATHRTHLSAPHLTPEIIAKAETMFRKAELAVQDDPVLLQRVQVAHFPIYYMLVRRPNVFWAMAKKQNPKMTWSGVCRELSRIGRAAGIACVREGDHATELFDWADDMAKRAGTFPQNVMPPELQDADQSKVCLIQAAQFDGQVKFMTRVKGASDGWAQRIVTHGWSITNRFQAPKDFVPGKSYRVYVRVMGKARQGATGKALGWGIHHPKCKRVSAGADAAQMDGTWQTIGMGPWKATELGGTFYIAWNANASKTGMFAAKDASGKPVPPECYVDCLWLVEQD